MSFEMDAQLAELAAHGLDGGIRRLPAIVVPIALEVLVVRDDTTIAAVIADPRDPATVLNDLPSRTREGRYHVKSSRQPAAEPPRGPRPFTDRPQPRERGAHLHWALPDALLQLSVRPNVADVAAWALPDHWIVARFAGTAGQRRAVKVFTLGPLRATGSHAPFTAVDRGSTWWTGVYDSCAGCFAYHDPLDDGVRGPISYLVLGYYGDLDHDPLHHNIRGRRELSVRLDDLAWTVPDWPPSPIDGGPDPSTPITAPTMGPKIVAGRTVLHGAVVGIGWPDASTSWDGEAEATSAERVAVVCAPTTTEALAHLVGAPDAPPTESRPLEAFVLGALSELDEADGLSRIDTRLHDHGFAGFADPPQRDPRPPATATRSTVMPTPPPSVRPGVFGEANPKMKGTKDQVPHEVPAPPPLAPPRGTALIGGARTIDRIDRSLIPAMPSRDAVAKDRELSGPRWYVPSAPVVAIRGIGRSARYGEDRRRAGDKLSVRRADDCISAISVTVDGHRRSVTGHAIVDDVLPDAAPRACLQLLQEHALLDPASSAAIARNALGRGKLPASAAAVAPIATSVRESQTTWWVLRDPNVTPETVKAHTPFTGRLPVPEALRPYRTPWEPMLLEWEIRGEILRGTAGLALGELDFAAAMPAGVPTDTVVFSGRVALSAGATKRLASAVQLALDAATGAGSIDAQGDHVVPEGSAALEAQLQRVDGAIYDSDDPQVAALEDLQGLLLGADIVTASLDDWHRQLDQWLDKRFPLRAGRFAFTRLRVVDGFGQIAALSSSVTSTPRITAEHGELIALPRLLARARLTLRFVANDDATQPADATRSPVVGWLLPDQIDRAIEVCDAAGNNLGSLLPDRALAFSGARGFAWEESPGRAPPLGRAMEVAVLHPTMRRVLGELLRWDLADRTTRPTETALEALLRAIDTTRWTIDPYASQGEQHHTLLVGHAIAVVRVKIGIEVDAPAARLAGAPAFPVRIGSLARIQDGVVGWFVDDDFDRLHPIDKAVVEKALEHQLTSLPPGAALRYDDRRPITHPYIANDPIVMVTPGVERTLTILVEPHCAIHATSGVLPRKSIDLMREWIDDPIAAIAPTFRFGPVLVDPKTIRMPVTREREGSWSWDHRADLTTWASAEIPAAQTGASLGGAPARVSEGWLRFKPQRKGRS